MKEIIKNTMKMEENDPVEIMAKPHLQKLRKRTVVVSLILGLLLNIFVVGSDFSTTSYVIRILLLIFGFLYGEGIYMNEKWRIEDNIRKRLKLENEGGKNV